MFHEKGESMQWFKKDMSWKTILQEKDFGFRLLIGLIALIGLFFFLHFREVYVDMLELNSYANRYVVGQVDFEFSDDEETIILREKMLNNLGFIYKIDAKQVSQLQIGFKSFLLNDPIWKQKEGNENFEDAYKIASSLEDLLINLRFTSPRTLQRMKQLDINTSRYLVFSPYEQDDYPLLPEEYWKKIKNRLFKELIENELPNVSKDNIQLVIDHFEKQQWQLIPAKTTQADLIETIKKTVPQKYTRVEAGMKIVGQGDKITPRHLAMMQAMKQSLNESRNLFSPKTFLGSFIIAMTLIILCGYYLYIAQKDIFYSLRKLSLLVCIFVLSLTFAKIFEYVLLQSSSHIIESIRFPILIPFAALLVSILLNMRLSIFLSSFLIIIYAVGLAFDHTRFLIINLVAGLVVVIATRYLRRRTEVFVVSAKVIISVIPIFIAFHFWQNHGWGTNIAIDIIGGIVFMLVIAILVVGLLPILESLFNEMTDITLMEYMDPNNELLRRLTIEMPGTYQHSLVLGNLAEVAARTIGANGLFCRVATLYHDIGKLGNTHYFSENQIGSANIHQMLTPVESAQVIISHVTDGVILAKKYRLPQSFIDIIQEHHGTTLVYYFYCKEVELKGGDATQVDKNVFRYPGPKPHSKESAIIMISDAAEAASRSLDERTEATLVEVVDRVVNDKADDGQLDKCQLTFEELGKVKQAIIQTLMMSSHVRIKYPKRIEKEIN